MLLVGKEAVVKCFCRAWFLQLSEYHGVGHYIFSRQFSKTNMSRTVMTDFFELDSINVMPSYYLVEKTGTRTPERGRNSISNFTYSGSA